MWKGLFGPSGIVTERERQMSHVPRDGHSRFNQVEVATAKQQRDGTNCLWCRVWGRCFHSSKDSNPSSHRVRGTRNVSIGHLLLDWSFKSRGLGPSFTTWVTRHPPRQDSFSRVSSFNWKITGRLPTTIRPGYFYLKSSEFEHLKRSTINRQQRPT